MRESWKVYPHLYIDVSSPSGVQGRGGRRLLFASSEKGFPATAPRDVYRGRCQVEGRFKSLRRRWHTLVSRGLRWLGAGACKCAREDGEKEGVGEAAHICLTILREPPRRARDPSGGAQFRSRSGSRSTRRPFTDDYVRAALVAHSRVAKQPGLCARTHRRSLESSQFPMVTVPREELCFVRSARAKGEIGARVAGAWDLESTRRAGARAKSMCAVCAPLPRRYPATAGLPVDVARSQRAFLCSTSSRQSLDNALTNLAGASIALALMWLELFPERLTRETRVARDHIPSALCFLWPDSVNQMGNLFLLILMF